MLSQPTSSASPPSSRRSTRTARELGQPAGQGAPHHHPAGRGQRRPISGRRPGRTRAQHRRHHWLSAVRSSTPAPPHGLHPFAPGTLKDTDRLRGRLRISEETGTTPSRRHRQPHALAGRLRHGSDPVQAEIINVLAAEAGPASWWSPSPSRLRGEITRESPSGGVPLEDCPKAYS
jgi:hypothetical protein